MSSSINDFDIWIELDEFKTIEEQDINEDYCNAIIQFANGCTVGLNIWSEKYFYTQFNNLEWLDQQVAILPDILVRDFNASSIRQAITNLVTKHNWLEGRGFPAID